MDNSCYVARLLGVGKRFGFFDLAEGHLAAVEGETGVGGGEEGDEGAVLEAVAVASRDEGYEGAGALVVVVEGAAFVFDAGVGWFECHGCDSFVRRRGR